MIRRALQWSVVCLTLLVAPWSANAAQTVHLSLEIDGTAVIGESTIASLGRADSIECWEFEHAAARGPAGDTDAERRLVPTIVIRKPIDRTTPLLLQAMVRGRRVDGDFKFYRPDPTGTGAEQHFYTVSIQNGSILSVTQRSLGPVLAGADAPPMYEQVTFYFERITYTYMVGGIESSASAAQMRPARDPSAWPASDLFGTSRSGPTRRLRVTPAPLKRR
ncbi:MAG: type VI secretion system tube protein TssD [Armatimonadota bacterium]|jgi:type VI secretion system secreted protein Hcp